MLADFVGSTLCRELLSRGHTVRAMVHYNVSNLCDIADRVEIVKADIRFPDECMEAVKGVDAVAHLAALIHVDRSRRYPYLFWETNVGGTANMLEAARRYDADFLQMSTCESLGHIAEGKADERFSPKQPRSPYAASKLAAEAYVYSYHATYGIGKIARCFNITGPRQKSGGKGAVTSIFIDKVLRGEQLKIYGDGLQTRDYTDARDIARGLALMLERDLDGELIHLCSGEERSVNDVAETILRACNSKLVPVHVEGRPGELRRSVGDNSKARRVLGWSPEISFQRSVSDMVELRGGK